LSTMTGCQANHRFHCDLSLGFNLMSLTPGGGAAITKRIALEQIASGQNCTLDKAASCRGLARAMEREIFREVG
jgi:hypothetical protein